MPRKKVAKNANKLAAYRAKRDFTKTAEPSGGRRKGKAGAGFAYLIQKHAARRLHYDFRLEMDGALKSWAVTRGPSLDPADKRLAVHVEDHPLDYGSFEGTIPQGQYGGGTVMLWDQGSWEPVGDARREYQKGRLTFILHGKRLKGEWHLVRMHGHAAQHGKHENWLLIKSHDEYAKPGAGDYAIEHFQKSAVTGRSMEKIAKDGGQPIKETKKPSPRISPKKTAKKTLSRSVQSVPAFIAPQLATLVSDPPKGGDWVHEIKFDGYRALARMDGDDVKMLTRANNDWTKKFQSLADQIKKLGIENAIIDGEVVVMKSDGTMSFAALQQALSGDQQEKLHYYAFDILFLNNRDLRRLPLLERKDLLRKVWPKNHAHLHYSEHFRESGADVLEHACHIALEGIVSKRTDASYTSGRSEAWLKSKCINEQEFVIGGFTYQTKHPGVLGALLIGYYRGDDLIFAGKVGTGFTQDEARQLLRKLKPHQRKSAPFKTVPPRYRAKALWVDPTLAAQITFTEWTEDGVLRHPSYQGMREDKPLKQIFREKEEAPPPSNQKTAKKRDSASSKTSSRKGGDKLEIAGVTITHPDKVLFPDQGVTKRELAEYYEAMAPRMLPHVVGRPISLMRCPNGAGKQCFFQRHVDEGRSPFVKTFPIQINEKRDYLVIENLSGLMALVQMGVLEIHIWGAHVDSIDQPDRIVFDLDPAPGVPWARVKQGARTVRDNLRKLKLESFLEATGGKGLHIVVPLKPKADWKAIKDFTHDFAQAMARDQPKFYIVSPRKADRTGRIFIDYLRNGKGASAIAPYSTRARAGAPVAVPLSWNDLDKLKNAHPYSMTSLLQHLKKSGKDPWKDMEKLHQNPTFLSKTE